MKLLFLFALAVTILVAKNSSPGTEKKNTKPVCCSKEKCPVEKSENDKDDFFPLLLSPFNI